jgi:predicted RNase H-like HicB family nuclease
MKYRAIIKKTGEWWIGWLVDLPGVNAQEKTKEKLIESLMVGAEDMLSLDVPFEPEAVMTTIEIPEPKWATRELS